MTIADPTVKPARLRLDFIEGMRAVAALVVLLNHLYAQAWDPDLGQFPPPSLSFLTYSVVIGHLAVSVFIVISGFCLTLPVARGDGTLPGGTLLFFMRRARRILPPYYAALALSLLLIATVIGTPTGTLWDVAIQIRKTDVISHLVMMQHFFGTGRINYAFWSISLEWQLYFLFPLLVLLSRRWSAVGTLLLALVLGYATVFVGGRVTRGNLHYLGLFALGMAAAHVAFGDREPFGRLRARLPWPAIAGGAGLTAVALMALSGWRASIRLWPLLDLVVAVIAAALLVAAATRPSGPVASVFASRPLAAIGTFSYSLYLVHAPLLQLEWQYAVRPLGLDRLQVFLILLLAGAPLVVGASYLFHRLFEAPFMGGASRRPRVSPAVAPMREG